MEGQTTQRNNLFIWKGQPNYSRWRLVLSYIYSVKNLPFHMINRNMLTIYHVPGRQEILRKLIQDFDLEEFIVRRGKKDI